MRPVPPQTLRAIIWTDLRPVRPLWAPWQRAVSAVPLALAALILVPRLFGLREDALEVGPLLSWGASVAQAFLGVLLVGMAMREAVPGRTWPASRVAAALFGGVALMVGVTILTFIVSPTFAKAAWVVRFFWICWRDSMLVGVPVVLLSAVLVARARPLRPAVAGLLYGAGGGLVGDSAWRLFCEVSDPSHVLAAHGLAVLVLMAAGSLTAMAVERVRGR